nr:hypothetical protein [Tanacetum cinerariifolium]
MGNEELNTIPEKELDEFIKSSVEDLVPIPRESEDTSRSESVCILPSCDDFSPIYVPEEKAVTFSNLVFNSNDDFISSGDDDDESLSDEDVLEDNVKIYSNHLFEFDDEYISSDWRERFMNYLEEQTDGEAMIHSIQNAMILLKAYKMLLKGKCVMLMINDLKKCGYKKDNCELNDKFLNNLQPEWKHYSTLMRQTKNLMDINIDALYNILKQNQGDVNDALGYKKKAVVVTSDPLSLVAEKTKITALLAKAFNRKKYYAKPANNNLRTSLASSSAIRKPEYVKSVEKKEDKKVDEKKRYMSIVKCYNCKKEGHFAKECKKSKVKDYNYYKTKMLLAKKDSDEQMLLVEDQAWMESSSDSDQEINANTVFMAQIEKVLSNL